jgi:two-component sensor histidine kinase
MATLQDLVRQHTELDADRLRHLRRLVSAWDLLADLSFADLILFVPARGRSGDLRFFIGGHVRPATAQTLYREDQVGRFVTEGDRPAVGTCWTTQTPVSGVSAANGVQTRTIPVRFDGEILAVLAMDAPVRPEAERSELERTYLSVFEAFWAMVGDGTFPYESDQPSELSVRVGDGAIVMDRAARVTYTSPNAVSALHRLGFHMNAVGRSADDLGIHADVVRTAFSFLVPVTQELERGSVTTVHARLLPLIERSHVTGALVLLRDVSDLREQERRLVSMDATIREIHHRVKNNLQTVSSLLRLQGRRLESGEAKSAIDESVRRIRSIALVHEILAQDGGDDVRFLDVALPITEMVEQALVSPDRPVSIRFVGDGPILPASVSSSLAVVLTELLQNAVEHGYPPGTSGGRVTIELESTTNGISVRVHDDGVGLPDGFDLSTSDGLGLTIARTLAAGDLGGELSLRPAVDQRGTIAEIRASFEL